MIRLVFEKEIKEEHRILCPYCHNVLDLISTVQVSQIPKGITLSIGLSKRLRDSVRKKNRIELSTQNEIEKNSIKEIEV